MVEWFEKMQILVDADACPVVSIVEEIAEKYNIPSTLLCDTNHVLYSDYSEVIVVGAGADAVDYKLIICRMFGKTGIRGQEYGKENYERPIVSRSEIYRCNGSRQTGDYYNGIVI